MASITVTVGSSVGLHARPAALIAQAADKGAQVACLQELKCTDGEFPERPIANAGYRAAWLGQRTWNGVAILSKLPIEDAGDRDYASLGHARHVLDAGALPDAAPV